MKIVNHSIIAHDCAGAECPQCALPPVGRVTFGPLSNESHLPAHNPFFSREAFSSALSSARLATLRDSRGLPLSRFPEIVIPSTTVIICRGEGSTTEVLLHQRADNGYWGFVGGRQEPGESIQACAIREAKEESGFTVEIGPLVCLDSDPTQHAINVYGERVIQYMNVTFMATILSGALTCSEESQAFQWIPLLTPFAELPQPFLPGHAWRHACAVGIVAGGIVEVR